MSNFYLQVKSSLDKLAWDIAKDLQIGAVELDDVTNVEDDITGPDDLVVYQMIDMAPDPEDPLYIIQFEIGIKTSQDVGNFDLSTLISKIQVEVQKGDTFYLRDYSTAIEPTEDIAYLYIIDTGIDPQAFDGASGIRMQRCAGRIVRYS